MMNPLKKPYEAVISVENWIRKVHFPGKNTAKNVHPSTHTVFNHSFRGKLESYWKRLDSKADSRFEDFKNAIGKSKKKD